MCIAVATLPQFFPQSPQCNKNLFLVFAGEHHQVFNSPSLRQRLPAQSNRDVATCLNCTTSATHLKVLERKIAGKSEVAFHILIISGGGMRHIMFMGKNKKKLLSEKKERNFLIHKFCL